MARRKNRTAQLSALIAGAIPAVLAVTPGARAARTAEPSPAPKVDSHEVTWRDRGNNRYLSVKDGSKKNGGRVTTNPTDHNKQQHWRADYKSISAHGLDHYDMKNVNSGKCLAVGSRIGHKEEWTVVQEPCHGAPTWAEFSMYNAHHKLQGWLLITNPEGVAVCASDFAGKTVTSVFGQEAPQIISQNGHNAQTKGCIWH